MCVKQEYSYMNLKCSRVGCVVVPKCVVTPKYVVTPNCGTLCVYSSTYIDSMHVCVCVCICSLLLGNSHELGSLARPGVLWC